MARRKRTDRRSEGRSERPGRGAGHQRPAGTPRAPRDDGPPRRTHPPSAADRGTGPWLYGLHAVAAALANPARRCTRLLATRKAAEHLPRQAAGGPLPPEIVEREEIEAVLPPGAVHQGVALLAGPLPDADISDLAAHALTHPRTLALALDQVTDPQNVGAVLRSAAAFGAAGLIVTERHAPEATGALAKAASGALEAVPLIRQTNLVRALETLKKEGFWVVGLDAGAPQTLAEAELPERCVLVLGAEGAGLRRLTRETCDIMVRIPMAGAMESLNVSASAAVALYEWARQGASV